MKTYKTFISELFDRKIPMKPSSTGDTTWGYTFVLMNKGGKAELAPQGKDLEAFVIGWFLKNKSTDIVPTLGSYDWDMVFGDSMIEFAKEFKPVAYTVEFYNIKFEKDYSDLELMSDGDIRNNVWELSFSMREASLTTAKRGMPGRTGRFLWNWDTGTDEEVNRFSAADAAMILGAVTDAAKDFVNKKNPRGIIFGTKETANPARGRIYRMIARVTARETGGEVTEIDSPRTAMANGVVVWFDKKNPFILAGEKTNPYPQKA